MFRALHGYTNSYGLGTDMLRLYKYEASVEKIGFSSFLLLQSLADRPTSTLLLHGISPPSRIKHKTAPIPIEIDYHACSSPW
jgi:hypothetical protein